MDRVIAIGDFVSDEMLAQIKQIGVNVAAIERLVISPNMKAINRKLRQENDSRYLAYCVVSALEQTGLSEELKQITSVTDAIESSWGRWKDEGEERGYRFRTACSRGWTVRVGYGGGHQDGTASREGVIMHLTPEQARLARARAQEGTKE